MYKRNDETAADSTTLSVRHLVHPNYRADIDGLRAIAVLSVVGFHFFPMRLQGGFVGVDIFFVISGYLISSIIFSSLDTGDFNFVAFYVRRIKRIFPALILVLVASYIMGWFFLLPNGYKQLGIHIAGGSSFVSNFVLWNEAGYFDNASPLKPLLHLWSLGIEEQFYIIWPLLLYLAWRRRFYLLPVTLLVLAASFVLNVRQVHVDMTGAFYSPVTRFWELLIGAVLAYGSLHEKNLLLKMKNHVELVFRPIFGLLPFSINVEAHDIRSTVGAACIVTAVVVLDQNSVFPGWWALLPTVGAFLMISGGRDAWINRKVLSHKLMVWFGLISYPLYLWHWSLLSFAMIRGDVLTRGFRISLILFSVVLAWGTYKFIEIPVRFGKYRRKGVTVLCSLVIIIGLQGYNTYMEEGYGHRYPKLIVDLATPYRAGMDAAYRIPKCFMMKKGRNFADSCLEDKKPLIFLWGDSYAAALYPGLKSMQSNHDFGIAQFTGTGCAPLVGWSDPNPIREFCKDDNDADLALIKKIKPDVVLLNGKWENHTDDLAWLDTTVSELKRGGITKIVLVGPMPQWQEHLPNVIFRYWRTFHQMPPLRMRFGLVESTVELDKRMRNISERLGVDYISPYQTMCNQEGCMVRLGDAAPDVMTPDDGHLGVKASEWFISLIFNQLIPSGTYTR